MKKMQGVSSALKATGVGILDSSRYVSALKAVVSSQHVVSGLGLTMTYSGVYVCVLHLLLQAVGDLLENGVVIQGAGIYCKVHSFGALSECWNALPPGSTALVKSAVLLRALLTGLAALAILVPMVVFLFNKYMTHYQVTADALLVASGKKVVGTDLAEEGYAGLVWVLMFVQLQVLDIVMPILCDSFVVDKSDEIKTGGKYVKIAFKLLALAMAAYLNGFYAFDNNWKARGFDAEKRFKALGAQAPYFVGFGLPLALASTYMGTAHGFIGGLGTFMMLFPVLIPLAAVSNNFGVPKGKPVAFMPFLQGLAKTLLGTGGSTVATRSTAASPASPAPRVVAAGSGRKSARSATKTPRSASKPRSRSTSRSTSRTTSRSTSRSTPARFSKKGK